MAFEFTWKFTFSDGEKVVERGDFIKSHKDTADGDFVRVISKAFTDTLQGVVGNRKDLKKWLVDEGVMLRQPFVVFPEEEKAKKMIEKIDKATKKAKKKDK